MPRAGRLRRVAGALLDLLYPPVCAVCSKLLVGGRSLCGECAVGLPRLRAPFCGSCGEHFDGRIDEVFVCPNCSHLKFSFEFARPAMILDERTRELIHHLKYGRQIHLAEELGRLALDAFADERLRVAIDEKWPLVPVPLHRSRLEYRHFNQAYEIARPISRSLDLPILEGLKRVRKTETQTQLSRNQRLENLRGAFKINRSGEKWTDRRGAILVDDVLTTGSTVDACAKVLKKAGFRRVVVVTVMRG